MPLPENCHRSNFMSVAESLIFGKLRKSEIIAVLILDRVEDAVPPAEALLEGGADAMELTLRTPAAIGDLGEITAPPFRRLRCHFNLSHRAGGACGVRQANLPAVVPLLGNITGQRSMACLPT